MLWREKRKGFFVCYMFSWNTIWRIRQKADFTLSRMKKIALPAEFLSTLNSFSKLSKVCWSAMLSKEGSLWSVISIYSISEISEAALDNDRALVLLDWGWEKEWQLVLLLTEMESGKFAVECLCDVWAKMKNKKFQINCFKILNECLKMQTTSPSNLEQLSTCNKVY